MNKKAHRTCKIIHNYFPTMFKGWDAIRNTIDCMNCRGTGKAPCSDNRTDCGFCK